MVQILRIMISNYIINYKDTTINKVVLSDTVVNAHGITLDEFVEDVVLKLNSYAKTIVMIIAALVLRININVLMCEMYDEEIVVFY